MIHVGYFIIITFFIAPAAPISNIKRVLCSDWLPNPLGIVVLDPAQREEVHGAVIFGQCRRWSRKKRQKRVIISFFPIQLIIHWPSSFGQDGWILPLFFSLCFQDRDQKRKNSVNIEPYWPHRWLIFPFWELLRKAINRHMPRDTPLSILYRL